MNAITTSTRNTRRRTSSRGRTPDGGANPIDKHVGARVRLRRTLLGMSQEKLGEALGLTFQQVQKYERGANRVGASRLFDLGRVLDVPVSFFFDGMDADTMASSPAAQAAGSAAITTAEDAVDPMATRETLELVRAYYAIRDPDIRKRVADLARVLGNVNTGAEG
jgi:transcriptional regulator with XRE-family HTH domain